ncbi:MAG: nuclear transport factor 2 family protein [Litoreibacter sp.]
MTDCIHAFFSAWGDPSDESREEKTRAALASNFYYADPNAPEPITDFDTYLSYVKIYGDMMPEGTAEVVSVSEHNCHARATVAFCKAGVAMQHGQYFADIVDGKITRLIGFAGLGEPKT